MMLLESRNNLNESDAPHSDTKPLRVSRKMQNYNDFRGTIYNNIEQLLFDFMNHDIDLTRLDAGGIEKCLLRLNAGKHVNNMTLPVSLFWDRVEKVRLAVAFTYHTDLMKMNNNIKASSTDNNYRYNKLFSIYNEFYIDDFYRRVSSVTEFSDIIVRVDNSSVLKSYISAYSESLSPIIPGILKHDFSYKNVVSLLNNPSLRQEAATRNFAKGVNASLYIALARHIAGGYSIRQMIDLILYCPAVVRILNELQRRYEIEQERIRLLSGNMDYEMELERLRLSLSGVMTGSDFESYLHMVFTKLGYSAELTKGSGDKGADLVLERNGTKIIVQAKYYSRPIGNKAVQQAYTAKDIYRADIAAVVTNSSFTKQAVEDAALIEVVLIDGDKLQTIVDSLAHGRFMDFFS